ncbi:MAG TPA: hypothetical protein PLE19_06190 [Planctomycetota bacterium]|nr:hypothetical protein [Planctomycetota bacterium]HRR81321.1 hypothetical protein [Planctomycetota bacterium]HRT93397.1 hypothetical protein [Planctomycetota bacterium]
MWRALLAAVFAGSMALGTMGCGEESAPPPPEKKQSKIEGIIKKAGEEVKKGVEEVKKDAEDVKKAVEDATK